MVVVVVVVVVAVVVVNVVVVIFVVFVVFVVVFVVGVDDDIQDVIAFVLDDIVLLRDAKGTTSTSAMINDPFYEASFVALLAELERDESGRSTITMLDS